MGSRGPAIICKRGVEDISQSCRIITVGSRSDVRRARPKVLKGLTIGQATMTKQVDLGSGNHTGKNKAVEDLRPMCACVTGDHGGELS